MSAPDNYAGDESNLRRQELLDDVFGPSTSALLEDLSVPSAAEVLDVGCGIGRTTRRLREHLSDTSRIVGLDADTNLLEVARDRSSPSGAVDMAYREGDARDLPFDDDHFDVVFARFLVTHLPEPAKAVEEFQRVCRPGGVVAVQEPDIGSFGTWPPSRAYKMLHDVAPALIDPQMGRKTWGLFREAGVEGAGGTGEPEVEAVVPVETHGTALREYYALTIEAIGGALLEKGELEPEEYEALVEEAHQVKEDSGRLTASFTVYSVWGRA